MNVIIFVQVWDSTSAIPNFKLFKAQKYISLISKLLSIDVRSFLRDHLLIDPNKLLLKYQKIAGLPASLVVDQLIGRKKAEERFPTWYQTENIIYPPALNLEQASSEKAAMVKVEVLQNEMGDLSDKTAIDLTGGFGVDSYIFSKAFKRVHVVEPNSQLLEITKHNHRELGALNIEYFHMTAESFLSSVSIKSSDVIFIDPSRRTSGDRKVFTFSESDPNVVALQDAMLQISAHVLIKSSPLMDIQVGLNELGFVKHVYVTSINNDCKEVLFFCERDFEAEATITAINVNGKDANFSFRLSEERSAVSQYNDPLEFIYEPNASLLKGGAFKILGHAFDFPKLHPNTHLFTSPSFNDKFPGRVFKVESIVKSDAKKLKEIFQEGKANIFTRNYPLSVNEMRKKYSLKDGGDKFLIACSGMSKKFLLVARRVR